MTDLDWMHENNYDGLSEVLSTAQFSLFSDKFHNEQSPYIGEDDGCDLSQFDAYVSLVSSAKR